MNKLLENDSKGHVDSKDIQKIKYLRAVKEIFTTLEQVSLTKNERYLRIWIETLKILGEETDNAEYIK